MWQQINVSLCASQVVLIGQVVGVLHQVPEAKIGPSDTCTSSCVVADIEAIGVLFVANFLVISRV